MFEFSDLNYVAVLAAFVYTFALGMIWYGPLFGKKWLAYVKATNKKIPSEKDKMAHLMVLAAINNVVAAFSMAVFVHLIGSGDWLDAFIIAMYATLGFASFPLLSGVIWEKRPLGLYLINVSYCFVSLWGMASIYMHM